MYVIALGSYLVKYSIYCVKRLLLYGLYNSPRLLLQCCELLMCNTHTFVVEMYTYIRRVALSSECLYFSSFIVVTSILISRLYVIHIYVLYIRLLYIHTYRHKCMHVLCIRTYILYIRPCMYCTYIHIVTYIRTYMYCISIYYRVSFRKMGKGGQNNTYKINGGGKGSARDSAPSRGSGDMTRFLLFISRITFFGGGKH